MYTKARFASSETVRKQACARLVHALLSRLHAPFRALHESAAGRYAANTVSTLAKLRTRALAKLAGNKIGLLCEAYSEWRNYISLTHKYRICRLVMQRSMSKVLKLYFLKMAKFVHRWECSCNSNKLRAKFADSERLIYFVRGITRVMSKVHGRAQRSFFNIYNLFNRYNWGLL
jgi:hypothetical protein